MNRHIVLIFALSGLYDIQLVDSQIMLSKSTKNSLNTITSLISGAYPPIQYVKLYAGNIPAWQNLADKELKSISVVQYLKSGNWFREMRRNTTFDYQIQQLISIIRKIETMFDGYVQHKENFSRYAEKNKFSNTSYRAYVQNVFRAEFDRIANLLDEITMIIAQTNSEHSYNSLTNAFVTNILKSGNVCETKLSMMQKIGQLLGYLTIVEVKGLLTILFAYDIKEWLFQDDFSPNKQLEQEKSLTRYNRIVKTFQKTLSEVSNEMHNCSPDQHVNGRTYFELEGLFQTYIIQESNAAPWLMCGGKCQKVSGKRNQQCWDRPAWVSSKLIKEVCMKTRRCDGVLQGCKQLRKEPHEYPKVCLSDEANTNRRYDFVTFDNNDNRKCDNGLTHLSADFTLHFKKVLAMTCLYCQCTCVKDYRKERKYRFSLQPSLAEYEKDYVVTGARLKKTDDNLIYIQIQQGQLLPHGGINQGSIDWIIPSLKNISTQEINWEFKRVNLDNLKVPEGHVVVGVMLKKNSVGLSKYLELQVIHLPYNATAGLLVKDEKPQTTIANNTKQSIYRRELWLSNRDVPTHFHAKEYHSPDNHYLLFQTTSLTKDGGQSTIPFIDTQDVNFKVPTPLSGVGLSYRGNEKSGGYLDLKLFSYNFTYDLLETKVSHEAFVNRIK